LISLDGPRENHVSYETFLQVEVQLGSTAWNKRWNHVLRVALPESSWLGGLLGGAVPLRGLPTDVSAASLEEGCVHIDDRAAALDVPDNCTRATAEKAVAMGSAVYVGGKWAITHPDYHSYTWLSAAEFQALLQSAPESSVELPIVQAVSAALSSFSAGHNEARLILWRLA